MRHSIFQQKFVIVKSFCKGSRQSYIVGDLTDEENQIANLQMIITKELVFSGDRLF